MMDAETGPVVRYRGVTHRYGDLAAVESVALEIPSGVTVGFIGPDGVGKSTLLSLMAGARRVQSGQVEVFGGDISDRRYRNRVAPRIAFMPQGLGRNLYATLSVYENVAFFGRLFGQGRAEREARISELLQSTGLAPFATRAAGKLSGGMKQKLGLCCALIHDPDLLILDEPTTGVDPLSRRQFWELIERLRARRSGMSVVDGGRVLDTGSPAVLLERTGAENLDDAFIRLLPEAKRRRHHALVLPPRRGGDATPAIEADDLTRRFGDFTAVNRVNLRIERGEIYGFLGSNGCGKTTTMKMLTGLLPASGGRVRLFGHEVDAGDMSTRRRVGYMSQSFSLYGELTVAQNLDLHARLFHLPEARISSRVTELVRTFGLGDCLQELAAGLPLGIRQRLSLAVAVVHEPEVLILDEPTSGVDPVARDSFWELLIKLSRENGVTIFISTHFMNEGERCDRISLMHEGRVLASDTPARLQTSRHAATLEQAFIDVLEEAVGKRVEVVHGPSLSAVTACPPAKAFLSLHRLGGYAWRESLELLRDPVRLVFALLGSMFLMLIIGYGLTLDVEDLRFAVLDYDNTPQSRDYIRSIAGSRYFLQQPPLRDATDMEHRLRAGDIAVAIEIPPGFGRDLKRGRVPEVGVLVDGSMPFRGEMAGGYMEGLHYQTLSALAAARTTATTSERLDLAVRYRYNQAYESLYAMVPAVIPLLLAFIPSILTALSVVREKELGSITNFYVTPVTRLEFLIGKQLPYVAVSMLSFLGLTALALWVFHVPIKGDYWTLALGALLYVCATTALGLLMSTFTRTQIAALAGAAIGTILPAVQFSGLIDPVASLEGIGHWIGQCYPTTYFLVVSRGVFTKALGFSELSGQLLAIALFVPVLVGLSALLLRKQER